MSPTSRYQENEGFSLLRSFNAVSQAERMPFVPDIVRRNGDPGPDPHGLRPLAIPLWRGERAKSTWGEDSLALDTGLATKTD
jgi:hypothetical protein